MTSQMLQNDLLTALETNENMLKCNEVYSDRNSDHDFGVVLDEFSPNEAPHHFLRYSDGSEEEFIFGS